VPDGRLFHPCRVAQIQRSTSFVPETLTMQSTV
jgi:hypothetical protein